MNHDLNDFGGAAETSLMEAPRDGNPNQLELGKQYQRQFRRCQRYTRFRLVSGRSIHDQRGQRDGRHRDSVQSTDLYAATYHVARPASWWTQGTDPADHNG